ncbi:MAG: FimV/HubP family polar landmark protein [Gammaproteobacteria bacterium]
MGALVLLLPGLAWAVGLGQIHSDTRIGQPLNARIPILSANRDTLQGLTVGLAKQAVYQQAGLRESDFLYNLKFQVKQGANGPYVLVTSTQPVRLPFLNILIHAHWSSGDVTRQYTLLLNPPVFANSQSGSENVETPSVPQRQVPIQRVQPEQPVTQSANPPPANRPVNPPPAQLGGQVEVRHGQTLWGIASRLGGNAGVGVNRMMIAIYRVNPQAFSGNINRLKAGATLRVPSREEVGQISSSTAKTAVAQQTRTWQAAKSGGIHSGDKTGGETRVAGTTPRAGADKGVSASHAGEVVLSAPKLTQSAAGGAASPGADSNAAASSVAAAGAAGATRTASGRETAANGRPDGAAGTAASVGGPAKVHNGALASLASATRTGTRPRAAGASGVVQAATAASAAAVAAVQGNQANQAANPGANGGANQTGNSPNTTPATTAAGSTVWNWLTPPKGWIVIALIVLLLILIALLASRRARAREIAEPDEGLTGGAVVTAEGDVYETGLDDDDRADAYDPTMEEEEGPTADKTEYTGGDVAMAVTEETVMGQEAAFEDEAGVADALAEAERYASHGDNETAARVLRSALAQAPERNDLRLRLLGALYAAGDGEAFRAEAEALHRRIPAESSDWQAAVVMGRRLLPTDPLFDEDAAAQGIEPPDFDVELDRLDEEESDDDLQSDFDRTLGELSTMIETYMPEHGEMPVELHLPPGEGQSAEAQSEGEPEEDVIEFEPTEGVNRPLTDGPDEMRVPAEEAATNVESVAEEGALSLEPEAQLPVDESDDRMQLDLARTYLDMGDRDSARDLLKDISANDHGAHREEAQRLLDELESSPGAEYDYEAPEAAGAAPEAVSPEADEPPVAEEDSGTAIDLARAYLEMGDRESARDILEEVLDGDEESQRQKARELLETLDA